MVDRVAIAVPEKKKGKKPLGVTKGPEFERKVGKLFSKWLSRGERDDLFRRNVLSGGQFTLSETGDKIRGRSGDLVDNHPYVYYFGARFAVECKHYRDLGIPTFLLGGESFLKTVVKKTKQQALKERKQWLVVACQNCRPPFVLFGEGAIHPDLFANLMYHKLFLNKDSGEAVYMMHLETFLQMDPESFLKPLGRVPIWV